MSAFLPNIPLPNDFLEDSQGDLLGNNQALNSVYGSDHYPYNDDTANSGKHKMVTTPAQSVAPTTTDDPKFFGFQDYSAIGVLQYSKGPNQPLKTPLTTRQSSTAPIVMAENTTIDILDFTGIQQAAVVLWFGNYPLVPISEFDISVLNQANIVWTGNAFDIKQNFTVPVLAVNNGSILQISCPILGGCSAVFWTLEYLRIIPT